jgi:paraquat-inducible protein B
MIEQGLRAQLEAQSLLTGQLFIQLDFHPEIPARFFARDESVPEIPTIPSTMEQLQANLQDTLAQLRELPLEDLISVAVKTLQNVNDGVGDFRALLGNTNDAVVKVDEKIGPILDDADSALDSAQAALDKIDAAMPSGEVGEGLDEALKGIQQFVEGLNRATPQLQSTLKQAEVTLATIENVTREDSRVVFELRTALRSLSDTSRSIKVLSDYLGRNPDALLFGKEASQRR